MVVISFKDFLKVIVNRRRLFVCIILSTILVTVIYSLIIAPQYEVRAYFIAPLNPTNTGLFAGANSEITKTYYPITDVKLLDSFERIFTNKILEEKALELSGDKKINVKTLLAGADEAGLFKIICIDEDPNIALYSVNTFFKAINILYKDISTRNILRMKTFLICEYDKAQENLNKSQIALVDFEQKNTVVSLSEELKIIIERKATLESQLISNEIKIKENEMKITSILDQLKEAEGEISSEAVGTNPVILSLRNNLITDEIKLSTLKTKYTDNHPDVIATKESIRNIQENLKIEMNKILNTRIEVLNPIHSNLRSDFINLSVEKDVLIALKGAIKNQLSEIEGIVFSAPEKEVELAKLKWDIDKYDTMVKSISKNIEEIKLQEQKDLISFELLGDPLIPENPTFPDLSVNILVSSILAIVIVIMIALYIAHAQKRGRYTIEELFEL